MQYSVVWAVRYAGRRRETLGGICCSILSCASAVDLPTAVLTGVLHRRRCVVLFTCVEGCATVPLFYLRKRDGCYLGKNLAGMWNWLSGKRGRGNQKMGDVQLGLVVARTRK